jgi:hypothetical protein
MAGMKGVSDDDTARWIFEDSEVEGEFLLLLLLSVGLLVVNTPDVLQPCGLLYYP